MTEREAAPQIDLFRVKTLFNHVAQEIFRANLREGARETYDYGLLNAQHA